jgi:hypothetical protein
MCRGMASAVVSAKDRMLIDVQESLDERGNRCVGDKKVAYPVYAYECFWTSRRLRPRTGGVDR